MTDDLPATLARLDELWAKYKAPGGQDFPFDAMCDMRDALLMHWPLIRRCAAAWVKVERLELEVSPQALPTDWLAWSCRDDSEKPDGTGPTPLAAVEAVEEITNPTGEPQ